MTGASKGLGRVVATFLARRGFHVIVTARTASVLDGVARDLLSEGHKVTNLPGNIDDDRHRRRLAEAAAKLGGLDVLVNNASSLGPAPLPPLAEYPLDELKALFATNVVSQLGMVQAVLPLFAERHGLVVNVTSDAAVEVYPGWGGYGASKAALELLSRTLADELRPLEVAVVLVDPGDMRTDMHQAATPGEDMSDLPPPEVTVPFWAWLFEQDRLSITGQRFRAQGEMWAAP